MFYKNVNEFRDANGYEIDGHWYPRVTAIVSIKAKPALYHYYAGHDSFASAEAAKNKSAEEGTLVHEVIEKLLAGEKPPIPDSVASVVAGFEYFRKQHDIIPQQIESKILSKEHGYAGTIDVLAEVDGKLGVLDIKTSQAIYRDYGLQTAAYVQALREKESMPELTRWILRLDQSRACLNACGARMREKGGNVKIKENWKNGSRNCPHTWGEVTGDIELKELGGYDHDIKAFLAAKTLWEWEHHEWLSKIA